MRTIRLHDREFKIVAEFGSTALARLGEISLMINISFKLELLQLCFLLFYFGAICFLARLSCRVGFEFASLVNVQSREMKRMALGSSLLSCRIYESLTRQVVYSISHLMLRYREPDDVVPIALLLLRKASLLVEVRLRLDAHPSTACVVLFRVSIIIGIIAVETQQQHHEVLLFLFLTFAI